jgi:hypothetical protein
MVAINLGAGFFEVDLHHCVTIGRLSPVLKQAVDENCFCVFDTCKARRRSDLVTYSSDEFPILNRSSDQQIQSVMNRAD